MLLGTSSLRDLVLEPNRLEPHVYADYWWVNPESAIRLLRREFNKMSWLSSWWGTASGDLGEFLAVPLSSVPRES